MHDRCRMSRKKIVNRVSISQAFRQLIFALTAMITSDIHYEHSHTRSVGDSFWNLISLPFQFRIVSHSIRLKCDYREH